MAENVFYFGGIPLAEYALPSSMELVENTSMQQSAAKRVRIFFMIV
jgi:hypothetical protein